VSPRTLQTALVYGYLYRIIMKEYLYFKNCVALCRPQETNELRRFLLRFSGMILCIRYALSSSLKDLNELLQHLYFYLVKILPRRRVIKWITDISFILFNRCCHRTFKNKILHC
jgi:hypothetical protein